ncbi:MAG: ankyrin repeat domain-containing protein [Acidobacteria bacterium]|nr:ankyrin repeat domain-containing protein [Acidobacteriota bacterium]
MKSLSLFLLTFAASAYPQTAVSLFDAIRSNDLATLRATQTPAVNIPGRLGLTPLMYAAAFGSQEAIEILLGKGAELNAKDPRDATALHYAAWDAERTKLLLSRGANPNALSKIGRTPLLVAASSPTGARVIPIFLEKGANPMQRDATGFNLLQPAAIGNTQVAAMLLEKGFPLKDGTDLGGFTPLHLAVIGNNLPSARLLLAKGADPNAANTFAGKVKFGLIDLRGISPLMFAGSVGSPEMVTALLDAGANPNQQDVRGMTPLMYALSSEKQNLAAAKILLARGAKVDLKMKSGDTAADWAHRSQWPGGLALVKGAPRGTTAPVDPGKPAPADGPRAAAERALTLLGRTSQEFFQQSGCGACHHGVSTLMAANAARASHLPVAPGPTQMLSRGIVASIAASLPSLLQGTSTGGATDTASSYLAGLAAANYPADINTDILAHYIAVNQAPDGSWYVASRSPKFQPYFESGSLRSYPLAGRQAEFDTRIARAKQYLISVQPITAYEHAEKLIGLHWAGASPSELQAAAKPLLGLQRKDGGFSQTPHLSSDAYATGIVLWALQQAAVIPTTHRLYQRGVKFLVATQRADGSWYVASRSPKFQPYFESGFPYQGDQWISSVATAYATMALAPVRQ